MDSMPVHLRITGLTVSNEDVDSRRKAAAELAATWGKISDTGTITAKSAEVAQSLTDDGHAPAALAAEVEAAVQKHASAFLATDRPLEIGICAGMAMMAVLKPEPGATGWLIADVYSNALWSALGFQEPLGDEKREALRVEVLQRARERSLASANKARLRDPVPDVGDLTVTIADDGKVTNTFKKALNGTLDALTKNAALDREELDFLWWVQLGRSRLLSRPFAGIGEGPRLVAAGVEAGIQLRRLPADVHREIVLRTLEQDGQLTLVDLLNQLGDDRQPLAAAIPASTVTGAPLVFPLLNALISGSQPAVGGDRKFRASDWGSRALLETGLAHMIHTGVKKL